MNSKTIEQRLSELEARVAKLEVGGVPSHIRSTTAQKEVSAKEFLMTKEIKTDTQKTLALGYYLEHIKGMLAFNIEDLATAFQVAKEKRPSNINDTVNKNVARGLLMDAPEKKDSKKAWVLTSTGEKYIEEELTK